METSEKVRENKARRVAKRLGLGIRKSRVRTTHLYDFGGYRIIDRDNRLLAGEKFELSLDDVEGFLVDYETRIRQEREA